MFLSAVSFLILAKTGGFDLNEREMRAWKKVQSSIVFLLQGQSISGTATLIDRDGLFLADRSAFTGTKVEGRGLDGHEVHFVLLATDDPTQFVLLKAEGWNSDTTPVTLAEAETQRSSLLAVTTNGPVRAEKVGNTFGIVNPSRRFMPLSEVRLENTQASLGGALLFNLDGQLVGALNATLEVPAGQSNFQQARNQQAGFGGGPGGSGTGGGGGARGGGAAGDSNNWGKSSLERNQNNQYGPGMLATAYTFGPRVLRRVVEGFRSPTHEVLHPSIGIICRNAVPTGALIDSVKPGSTADKAGLKKNDIITKMNNLSVQNQFDFARIMLDQEVGATLRIWVQRESGLVQMVDVPVGK